MNNKALSVDLESQDVCVYAKDLKITKITERKYIVFHKDNNMKPLLSQVCDFSIISFNRGGVEQ